MHEITRYPSLRAAVAELGDQGVVAAILRLACSEPGGFRPSPRRIWKRPSTTTAPSHRPRKTAPRA